MNLPAALISSARVDRREQILSAAGACFARLGLQATRVEDILLEAGISRATFYRYYDNIDAVLMRLTVRAARAMMVLAVNSGKQAEGDGVRRVARVVAELAGRRFDQPILAMVAKSAEMLRLANLVTLSPNDMAELAEPLVPLLDNAVASGELRTDIGIDRMIEWVLRNATSIRHRLPPWAHDVAELEEYVMDFVMPALLPRSEDGLRGVIKRLDGIEAQLRGFGRHLPQ